MHIINNLNIKLKHNKELNFKNKNKLINKKKQTTKISN